MRLIVAITDTLAGDIVGPLMLHKVEATALRVFDDVIRMEGSQIGQHLNDHEMRVVGFFDEDTLTVHTEAENGQPPYTLITGKQWLASQPKQGDA